MTRHVVRTAIACPRCGSSAEQVHVATSRASGLRYSVGLVCRECSLAEEADGPALTEAGRAAFYAAEGRWSARIEDLGPRRAEALRAIRTLRDDPPAALSRVLSGAAPVVEGTLAEVECVELALEEAGAELVMSRLA